MYSSDLHGKSERLLKAFEEKVTLRGCIPIATASPFFFFFLAFTWALLLYVPYRLGRKSLCSFVLCRLGDG